MKTPAQILRELVTDIDAMRSRAPRGVELESDTEHWFGGFEVSATDEGGGGEYVEWPNLSILAKEAREVLDQAGAGGAGAGPKVGVGESRVRRPVQKLLSESEMKDAKQWFRNHYRHCGQEWEDEWDCMCNDECPVCGAEIEPFESEELDPKTGEEL